MTTNYPPLDPTRPISERIPQLVASEADNLVKWQLTAMMLAHMKDHPGATISEAASVVTAKVRAIETGELEPTYEWDAIAQAVLRGQ